LPASRQILMILLACPAFWTLCASRSLNLHSCIAFTDRPLAGSLLLYSTASRYAPVPDLFSVTVLAPAHLFCPLHLSSSHMLSHFVPACSTASAALACLIPVWSPGTQPLMCPSLQWYLTHTRFRQHHMSRTPLQPACLHVLLNPSFCPALLVVHQPLCIGQLSHLMLHSTRAPCAQFVKPLV
jgi:hypothetical protein